MSDRALLAAQGYLELGMVDEALDELSFLKGFEISDPEIVELRLHILMQGQRWDAALTTAQELLQVTPDAVPAYIHGAFALHELGRTLEARDLLLKGPPVLRKDPTFQYNIGCYEAVLGNRESAMRSLGESFALDETYRDYALQDPDLKTIYSELSLE